jgi:hypothetical protein
MIFSRGPQTPQAYDLQGITAEEAVSNTVQLFPDLPPFLERYGRPRASSACRREGPMFARQRAGKGLRFARGLRYRITTRRGIGSPGSSRAGGRSWPS